MRRLLSVLLIVLILSSASGCTSNSDNFKKPANFYYRSTSVSFSENETMIIPELRETVVQKDNILEILNTYLSGPVSDKLISPFPNGLKVTSIERSDNTLIITFNKMFSVLSGLDLTLACSCICATVTELTGCRTIEIKSEGQLSDNVPSIIISYDDLLFVDFDT